MERCDVWRHKLIGPTVDEKREIYYVYVVGRDDIEPSALQTIRSDMPRTYPALAELRAGSKTVQKLLVQYAAVHRGDSYLQGFNYIMTILWHVFKDQEHGEADTWWCFSRIVGLIRPLMPDFNVTWFHWMRRDWLNHFNQVLRQRRPKLASILCDRTEEFSSLVTVRWFMIWFAQTVAFTDIFKLWDFIIDQPPHLLMKTYVGLTFQILYEAAPSITYQWSHEPTKLMHAFLSLNVEGIDHAIAEVKKRL